MIRAGDPRLLAKLRAGGLEALAEAFTGYRPQLERMIEQRIDPRLQRRVGAADILQEGFLDAARRLDDYLAAPRMPLYTWLRFLVRQQLLAATRRHLKAKKRDARREQNGVLAAKARCEPSLLAQPLSARLLSPGHAAVRAEMRALLQAALANLSPPDRQMILLRHFEGLSNAEAANTLGLTVSAASKRYRRALERLKRAINAA